MGKNNLNRGWDI